MAVSALEAEEELTEGKVGTNSRFTKKLQADGGGWPFRKHSKCEKFTYSDFMWFLYNIQRFMNSHRGSLFVLIYRDILHPKYYESTLLLENYIYL